MVPNVVGGGSGLACATSGFEQPEEPVIVIGRGLVWERDERRQTTAFTETEQHLKTLRARCHSLPASSNLNAISRSTIASVRRISIVFGAA